MTTLDTRPEAQPRWQRYKAAHHWRSAAEEFDACKLGFWLFLSTEVLLFGGIFCSYAIFRTMHPEAWKEGSSMLDWRIGCFNTGVLLVSSYTMATSIYCIQTNKQSRARLNMIATMLMGAAFVCIKLLLEYIPKWSGWFFVLDPTHSNHGGPTALGGLFYHIEGYGGKRPGNLFEYPFAVDGNMPLWWSVYYCGTAIHALHVLIGMALIFRVYILSKRGVYGPTHYTGVEIAGLYWHLVDLIWIFLFPLLYLIH